MGIKDMLRGGMDGEHPHGAPRSAYDMKQTKDAADAMMGYETGNVPPLMTADGIKQTAINAGNKIAHSGYGTAAVLGATAGGAVFGGGVNLAAGEVGHPAENMPVIDGPHMLKGMAAGAAIGIAGKFANDIRKMPVSRKQK